MEPSLNTICFMLACLTLCSWFQCSSASGSSSSSGELETEKCGKKMFYCPHNDECFDRKLRCTSSMVCVDINNNEANCHETGPGSGRYDFYRKKSPLKGLLKLADHWFVEYRGFVYEFGSAGYQELDINDPNYKYGPGREKVTAEDLQGTSSCTRDEVTTFIDKWLELNPNYHLIANNCQDFAKAVINELRSNCPHRVKRQADESLKAQCSAALSCTFFLNWKLYALLGPVVAFAMSS